MWLDWLVFCDYGFSVSDFWCPLATPTILLGCPLPWTWDVSSWLLQQSAATAPYLGWGVSPHHHPFLPWTCSSSFLALLHQHSHCSRLVGTQYATIGQWRTNSRKNGESSISWENNPLRAGKCFKTNSLGKKIEYWFVGFAYFYVYGL